MNKKNLNTILIVIAASLMMVLFNNFTVAPEIKPLVNEASRVSHAKELLGRKYQGSHAQKLEGQLVLNNAIADEVRTQLPARFKGQAQRVALTVISESSKYQLDPVFVLAIIKTESQFNPLARGTSGEIGMMQVKPDTAEWIAKKYSIAWKGSRSLEDPSTNIKIGLAYMDYLRAKFSGAAARYVSAYNMGPTNVRRLIAKNVKPAEYATRVMTNYGRIYSSMAVTETASTKVALN